MPAPLTVPAFWNYRIVRRVHNGETSFALYKVHYYADRSVFGIDEVPLPVEAETVDGLRALVEWTRPAFGKPILDYDTLQPIGHL